MQETAETPGSGKPAYVYHEGTWRPYLWRLDLLQITCLGDVITGLECETSHDCAASHLYSNPSSPVDIIALRPPSESVWREATRVCGNLADRALGTGRAPWET